MAPELVSLRNFCDTIYNNHPEINYGGCCVFASVVGKHLAKVGKVRIRVADYEGDNKAIPTARKKTKRNTVAEWNRYGVTFGHVIIEFIYKNKRYYVDARGVFTKVDRCTMWPLYDGALTLKEATDLANCAKGWNRSFNRREIPMIERRARSYFKSCIKKGRLLTRRPI